MSNIAAASISHMYNFTGPALSIDTACSSFLVALTQAVAAIQDKRISGAVVGGAEHFGYTACSSTITQCWNLFFHSTYEGI
ncbi:beta-ketoacyl synthase N-terminal-like domain-containing protein [Paenibacillus amylolyticus]|nr:beta-ketoacyl synthase N-terminal-like domain-containing protein [Paenibacillus amylolyticus]